MNSDRFLDMLARTLLEEPELFLSLHVGPPERDGQHELGSTTRLPVTLSRVGPGALINSNVMEFTAGVDGTITHYGVWMQRDGGDYLTGGIWAMPVRVTAGQPIRVREAEIALRFG